MKLKCVFYIIHPNHEKDDYVITYILRFILIWWILSTVWRWIAKDRQIKNRQNNQTSEPSETPNTNAPDIPLNTSSIEDADFEELDGE